MRNEIVRMSKFVSLVLRHKPEAAGLELDENGWAEVEALIEGSRKNRVPITRELLIEIVDTNEKRRFAFSDDGLRIRANQGHSISVDVELEEREPPEFLFHGTATRYLDPILSGGLKKMSRQHVHLSPDMDTATKVGRRHGKPVVLIVKAAEMAAKGAKFYVSKNGVWLTDFVDAKWLLREE
ncbi:MAG: RNA 2'-phosphotransferase [Verrucomicrobiota bacterium]